MYFCLLSEENYKYLIFKSLSGILDNYMMIYKDSLLFLSFFHAFSKHFFLLSAKYSVNMDMDKYLKKIK